MTARDLDITDWQLLKERFMAEKRPKEEPPVAMRIENTQLTIARHFGGIRYNGENYTYFEPIVPHASPNPDGSPHVAWLVVRDDFLKWVSKELKAQGKGGRKGKREKDATGGGLFDD